MTPPGPLTGLRVVADGRDAGIAFCARLLSQLGAEVRRLDNRSGRDGLAAASGHFDLILTDLQPSEPQALLRKLNDRVQAGAAVVSVTRFGLAGPPCDYSLGEAILAHCRPDVTAALVGSHAALAALAALRLARHEGRTLCVEAAAVEVLASCLGGGLAREICPRRQDPPPTADRTDSRLAVLTCADGFIGVAASTEDDRALLAAMTEIDALRDPGAELPALLAPWVVDRTRTEIFELAQTWRLPVVPVLTPDEVRRDAQNVSRQLWEAGGGLGGPIRSPFRFTPAEIAMEPSARPGPLPLSDVHVLDLGMVWAGPYCGRLLTGLGAHVTKVEGPTRRDGTRPTLSGQCEGVFADLNRGKRSLVLDLSTGAGRDLFLRLAEKADLVIENFSPRVMPNFGLAFDALSVRNPGLLMLSMPAFGASGPWAHYVAYGSGLELATGLTGYQNGRPVPSSVAYIDYLAGCYGAVGVVAALLARDRSGRGAHLELAQREVACQLLADASRCDLNGPAMDIDPALVARDRHLGDRGLLARPVHGSQSCAHYARLPFQLHGVPAPRDRPAPAFGADSQRILANVGLEPLEVDRLVTIGAVGSAERTAALQ